MPSLRPCIKCGALSREGACPKHRSNWRDARTTLPSDWPKLRAQVLREEPRCRYCRAPATEVDHIVNRAQGGTDARSNLQALCSPCHRQKTQAESNRGRR